MAVLPQVYFNFGLPIFWLITLFFSVLYTNVPGIGIPIPFRIRSGAGTVGLEFAGLPGCLIR